MDTLTQTVSNVVMAYARKGLNSQSYFTHDNDNTIFSVVTVSANNTAFVSVLVRLSESLIIVEQDRNDKAVVDALVEAGIERERISLAYKDEPVPVAV